LFDDNKYVQEMKEEFTEPTTKEQIAEIGKLLEDTKPDMDKFNIYLTNKYKTPKYETFNSDQAKAVIATLKAKLKAQGESNA